MYCVYRQQQTLMITSIGCFPTVSVESKSIVWSMKSPSCCQMKWTLIRSKKRNCALTVTIVIYWRIIYFWYPFNDLYCIKIHLILYFISARYSMAFLSLLSPLKVVTISNIMFIFYGPHCLTIVKCKLVLNDFSLWEVNHLFSYYQKLCAWLILPN
jgi:hypothetical protein